MGALTTLRSWHWQLARHLDYHVGEAIRFRWFLHLVLPLITTHTRAILDAGCGTGKYTFYLAQRFPHIRMIGLDNREDVVARAEAQARQLGLDNLHFTLGDLTKPLPENAYDLIYSIDVLEHIEADVEALQHMARALRPGGWLAVHTPLSPQKHWLRRFDLEHLKNPLHAREGYRRGELENKIEAVGLSVKRSVYTHGRWGTLAWDLWKWSRYRIGRTLLLRPLIHLLVAAEVRQELHDGNCTFVLARREPVVE